MQPKLRPHVPLVGEMAYYIEDGRGLWFKTTRELIADLPIEVTIYTWHENEPSQEQVDFLKSFPANYESLMNLFLKYLEKVLTGTDLVRSFDELKMMYYLCAIAISPNMTQVDYTLEPDSKVLSRYNYFQRFRVTNNQIVRYNAT